MGILCPLVLPVILSLQVEMQAVLIEGAEALSSQKIEELLDLEEGDPIDEDGLSERIERVLTEYRDLGYIEASIKWQLEESVLHLAIKEGDLYRLGRVEFTGNRFFSSDYIASDFRLRTGEIFSDSALEEEVERLLDKYEDRGFPFCAIRPQALKLDEIDKTINLTLEVDEGPLTRIETVDIVGNTRTREYVILRELAMEAGEVHSRMRLRKGLERLRNLNVLTVSEYEIEQTRPGWVTVVIPVEEKSSNSIEGAAAWAPKSQLTGSINLRASNLFGTLRSFSLQYSRRRPVSYYLRIGYEEPWLFGAPLSGKVNVETEVEDTTYTLHSGSVHLFSRTLDPFDIGIGVGADRAVAFTSHVPNSNGVWVALDAIVDTRDSQTAPQSGMHYALAAKLGLKRTFRRESEETGSEEEFYSARGEMTLANFVRLGSGVVYVLVAGGKLVSREVSAWEMFRLGGTETVRGYREEQFAAPEVVWSNVEYRFLLGRQGWFGPFVDCGYYRNGSAELIYGWGLGMGLTSRIGLVTIHYGLGKDDSIGNGKVHIGLVTDF